MVGYVDPLGNSLSPALAMEHTPVGVYGLGLQRHGCTVSISRWEGGPACQMWSTGFVPTNLLSTADHGDRMSWDSIKSRPDLESMQSKPSAKL